MRIGPACRLGAGAVRRAGGEHHVLARERHRAGRGLALHHQGDVHGEVDASFGVLAGAVERVHDPHPACARLGARRPGLTGLLGAHGVVGSRRRQRLGDVVV